MGKHRHGSHEEDDQDRLNGRHRCNFPAQWEQLGADVVDAQHRQARNLVVRSYVAVNWDELLGERWAAAKRSKR